VSTWASSSPLVFVSAPEASARLSQDVKQTEEENYRNRALQRSRWRVQNCRKREVRSGRESN
jgi:hypothetical protein